MRAKELRERTAEELLRLKAENADNLFQARLKNATHQLDDSSSLKKSRREIARINTILSERKKQGDKATEEGGEE